MNIGNVKEFLKMIGFELNEIKFLQDRYDLSLWWIKNERKIYDCLPHTRGHVDYLKFWQKTNIEAEYFVKLGRAEYA